ncbi:hypothetical protein [Streptomyces ipomoeae]|uniref:hypothetical protein n=1 Tax=Streptomyces ipomoeae TaxID=103232 RepID=UPI001FD4FA55|nr:hypothetical protein [Streptomyces ipomoeae]MDX2936426.1 hypothetical protein [Streptomyces ipomoeae]
MQTQSPSPQPSGAPRWVAMFHEGSSGSWRVGAESPYRLPVLYAVGEMTQTLRARGEDPAVVVWGPKGGGGEWQRHEVPAAVSAPAPPEEAAPSEAGGSTLAERMTGRRQQVLLAGLGKAGLYDLSPEDSAAVEALVDRLDETTVRRVAHWLAVAGGER